MDVPNIIIIRVPEEKLTDPEVRRTLIGATREGYKGRAIKKLASLFSSGDGWEADISDQQK